MAAMMRRYEKLKQTAAPSKSPQPEAPIPLLAPAQQPQIPNQRETPSGSQSVDSPTSDQPQTANSVTAGQYGPTSANRPTSISNCIKHMRKEHTRLRPHTMLKVAEVPSNEVPQSSNRNDNVPQSSNGNDNVSNTGLVGVGHCFAWQGYSSLQDITWYSTSIRDCWVLG
ncbi:hypothetical protein PILCRDRAFT_9348 [Piloderma croceum F 1598]|uniref:Uncharacterized protein n=1 Tax=Piloderma croceum (strain F 1598) TaxID=765440 RepID=A0A0C3FNZ7_PILCF|nr:hypothetical protein PILCRDRAFT_9348 [Piloderma croceum F 1598]